MRIKSVLTIILVFLGLLSFPLPLLKASAATDKAADFENMRKIGQALTAFQQAKGQYPDYLSDLVPKFLDATTLVSPLGMEGDPHAAKGEYDPRLPCSYSYEFGARKFPNSDQTFRVLKSLQLQELGPTVPIVRCFLYGPETLNLSHAGDLFVAATAWEFDEGEVPRLLKKNGPGPGIREGKMLVVTVTDEAGHPIPGLVVRAFTRLVHGFSLPLREDPTNAEGKVVIPLGASEQTRVELVSASPEWYLPRHAWFSKDDPTPSGNDLVPLRLTAEPAGTMGGVVRDTKGAPVAGAVLTLFAEPTRGQVVFLYLKKTDASGAWSAPSIPKKCVSLQLDVHHRGYRWLDSPLGVNGVPDAAALFSGTANIILQPPFTVKGVVRSDGHPVAHASVTLDPRTGTNGGQAVTDEEGRFEVAAELEGDWSLITVADGLAPKGESVKIVADAPPLAVNLETGRPLKGRILRGNNTPVAHAPILFRGFIGGTQSGDAATQPVIATTDEDGRFTWPQAPRDVVACTVLLPEGGDPPSFTWHAEKNEPLEVHLKP